ncbi:MAG: hypothetical protein MPJ22_00130 [Pirellulales bacterium]|nr:hypothetical protein [Pirellulales bacterium]MDA8040815.1 hypothetical protein [Pirellulales bacterium]
MNPGRIRAILGRPEPPKHGKLNTGPGANPAMTEPADGADAAGSAGPAGRASDGPATSSGIAGPAGIDTSAVKSDPVGRKEAARVSRVPRDQADQYLRQVVARDRKLSKLCAALFFLTAITCVGMSTYLSVLETEHVPDSLSAIATNIGISNVVTMLVGLSIILMIAGLNQIIRAGGLDDRAAELTGPGGMARGLGTGIITKMQRDLKRSNYHIAMLIAVIVACMLPTVHVSIYDIDVSDIDTVAELYLFNHQNLILSVSGLVIAGMLVVGMRIMDGHSDTRMVLIAAGVRVPKMRSGWIGRRIKARTESDLPAEPEQAGKGADA